MQTKIINSTPYTLQGYWKKLLRYGFLVKVLAQRELKVKYSRTLLGIGWFFLQPIAVVIVYSIFFKYLININSDNIPYTPFVFSGLVLWYLFTGIVSKGTYALVESTELINKVPFPRLIVVISKIVPVILECGVLLLLLFIAIIFNGMPLGLNSFTALFYFFSVALFSSAIGILCSMVAVKYRDLAHIIPIAMNFAIWLTPVFYPLSIVPQLFRNYLLLLNPVASAIDGMRQGIFFNAGITTGALLVFAASCIALLLAFYYFVKFEKNIVENL
jgi:lipopolysaccharide transport system permease protein